MDYYNNKPTTLEDLLATATPWCSRHNINLPRILKITLWAGTIMIIAYWSFPDFIL